MAIGEGHNKLKEYNYKIRLYSDCYAEKWDDFVLNYAANGNVFQTRAFLSYHSPKSFEDASILLEESNRIVAVVAANKTSSGFFSHEGTSCGGPVIGNQHCGVRATSAIVDLVGSYYEEKLSMRVCENTLGGPVNELIVFLLSKNYVIQPEVSAYKHLGEMEDFVDSIPHKKSRSATRKCLRNGFIVKQTDRDVDYQDFHKLLVDNLATQHEVKPTHTIDELLKLRNILKHRQKLVAGKNAEGHLCAAVWLIKATNECWHVQYIARDHTRNVACAVEATLCGAMEVVRDLGAKHLNLGICTEKGGTVLNTGLLRFKESLGCVHHNRYLLTPKP